MLQLICDTSHVTSQLALVDGHKLIQSVSLTKAAENLLPELQKLLKLKSLQISDIDLYVVVSGPGSFTGLRIGMAVIKTLAHLANKPAVGVSTLKALSETLRATPWNNSYHLIPVIHSSSNEFYCTINDQEQLCDRQRLFSLLPSNSFIFGMGIEQLILHEIESLHTKPDWLVETSLIQPHPLAIANLGLTAYQAKQLLSLSSQPDYLRVSEAERRQLSQAKFTA